MVSEVNHVKFVLLLAIAIENSLGSSLEQTWFPNCLNVIRLAGVDGP